MMTEVRWRRVAGFFALLLVGSYSAGAMAHHHGLGLGHDCACWDFHHFLLLPCALPAGLPPVLTPTGTYAPNPAPPSSEATPSQHSSRAPPA